jgi:hypothetical protein
MPKSGVSMEQNKRVSTKYFYLGKNSVIRHIEVKNTKRKVLMSLDPNIPMTP